MALTKGLGRELAPFGINVNAIAPGVVETNMTDSLLTPERRKAVVAAIPLGRFAQRPMTSRTSLRCWRPIIWLRRLEKRSRGRRLHDTLGNQRVSCNRSKIKGDMRWIDSKSDDGSGKVPLNRAPRCRDVNSSETWRRSAAAFCSEILPGPSRARSVQRLRCPGGAIEEVH